MTSRRTVLKLGVVGGVLLAVGGAASWFVGRNAADQRREVLAAMIPAFLDGALPVEAGQRSAAIGRTLTDVEQAIAGLSPSTRDDLAKLFALATAAPSRLLLTGLAGPWHEAGTPRIDQVLQGWRVHRLALLQSAYQGLHDLILGAWYAHDGHWRAIGYPGPPQL